MRSTKLMLANSFQATSTAVVFSALSLLLPWQNQCLANELSAGPPESPGLSKPLAGHLIKDSAPTRLARPIMSGAAQLHTSGNPTMALDSRQFVLEEHKTVVPATLDEDAFNQLFKSSATTAKPPDKPKKPSAIQPKPDNIESKGYSEDPNTLQGQLSILSKYDVNLLLDRSGSMAEPDCGGESRWEWCRSQTERLSDVTSTVFPDGFELILFALDYEDEGKRTLSNLNDVFTNNHPGGSTVMSGAIRHCFQQYLHRRELGSNRPLVIAVITDGMPQDCDEIRTEIIAMTHKMHDFNEVKITFLKVGNATEGDAFMRELDDGLVLKGAEYDIVDSKSFDELRRCGLLKALTDAITEKRNRYD